MCDHIIGTSSILITTGVMRSVKCEALNFKVINWYIWDDNPTLDKKETRNSII